MFSRRGTHECVRHITLLRHRHRSETSSLYSVCMTIPHPGGKHGDSPLCPPASCEELFGRRSRRLGTEEAVPMFSVPCGKDARD